MSIEAFEVMAEHRVPHTHRYAWREGVLVEFSFGGCAYMPRYLGKCVVCGLDVGVLDGDVTPYHAVASDGVNTFAILGNELNIIEAGPYLRVCKGSGKPPKDVTQFVYTSGQARERGGL